MCSVNPGIVAIVIGFVLCATIATNRTLFIVHTPLEVKYIYKGPSTTSGATTKLRFPSEVDSAVKILSSDLAEPRNSTSSSNTKNILTLGGTKGSKSSATGLQKEPVSASEDVELPDFRCARIEAFKRTVSPGSKRTFVATVLTKRKRLQSLRHFREAWKEAWPELEPRVVTAYTDNEEMPGISTNAVLYTSMIESLLCGKEFDYLFVLQDFALPVEGIVFPRVLDKILDGFEERNGAGLLLGGEFWHNEEQQEALKCIESGCTVTLNKIKKPFFFHGIVYSRKHLEAVASRLDNGLEKMGYAEKFQITADYMQWPYWEGVAGGGFATDAYLVQKNEIEIPLTDRWDLELPTERCKNIGVFKRTVSPISKRVYLAGVITLKQAPEKRVSSFRQAWKRAWPELEHTWFYTWRHPFEKRGLANTASHYRIAVEALRCGGDFDYLMLFEDDAHPFEDARFPDDLDRALDTFEAKNGSGMCLGGHSVRGYKKKHLRMSVLPNRTGLIRASSAFGSYAMLVPRRFLPQFAQRYEEGLRSTEQYSYVPDVQSWSGWRTLGGGGFITAPLLVDHRPQSKWSFTWHKKARNRAFEGERTFWRT